MYLEWPIVYQEYQLKRLVFAKTRLFKIPGEKRTDPSGKVLYSTTDTLDGPSHKRLTLCRNSVWKGKTGKLTVKFMSCTNLRDLVYDEPKGIESAKFSVR